LLPVAATAARQVEPEPWGIIPPALPQHKVRQACHPR
jgi:hypothetical protein